MSRRARTEPHSATVARAQAAMRFLQARRDMLEAMRVWIATQPADTYDAQAAANETIADIWKMTRGMDRIARNGVSLLAKQPIQAQNGNRPGAGNTEATVTETIRSVCTPSDGTPGAPVVFENHAAGQAGGMPT